MRSERGSRRRIGRNQTDRRGVVGSRGQPAFKNQRRLPGGGGRRRQARAGADPERAVAAALHRRDAEHDRDAVGRVIVVGWLLGFSGRLRRLGRRRVLTSAGGAAVLAAGHRAAGLAFAAGRWLRRCWLGCATALAVVAIVGGAAARLRVTAGARFCGNGHAKHGNEISNEREAGGEPTSQGSPEFPSEAPHGWDDAWPGCRF